MFCKVGHKEGEGGGLRGSYVLKTQQKLILFFEYFPKPGMFQIEKVWAEFILIFSFSILDNFWPFFVTDLGKLGINLYQM